MQQQIAQMANMNAVGGPVDGTPVMGNGQRRQAPGNDPRDQLHTYIYDYFMRNNHHSLAQLMITSDIGVRLSSQPKPSPSGRNTNGIDPDIKEELPKPALPAGQVTDNSFLLDWWLQFWDLFSAARNPSKGSQAQYILHSRNLTQMQNDARNTRLMMAGAMNPAQYNMMRAAMPTNGGVPNDLKRAAAMNARNPNATPMAMNQMKMMASQMQRDGSQMDMNGQRPPSPSNENGASPNKRPRVDGVMNGGAMAGNQFSDFSQQPQNMQQKNLEGMNPGIQGSPLNQQLDGQNELLNGNQARPGQPGMPGGQPGPGGNHALHDYQMQLMLLEQQNKRRLMMARQEQDSQAQGVSGVGAVAPYPNTMAEGNRAGPSPNPSDQMKRGTPKLGQQGLPPSPMPDQQQRNSPAPGMSYENIPPPGYPPQYGSFPQGMAHVPMGMRPPSSNPFPGGGQPMTQQQLEQMHRGAMQNGWGRGVPPGGPGAMMPGQQPMGPVPGNPQQRNQMPPPPAPPTEQPRPQEQSPAQPAAQGPPTPLQAKQPAPKKKPTKDNKKAVKKGPNAGTTPAATAAEEAPTPTPSTPMTPMHPNAKNFPPNGQPPPQTAQHPAATQPPPLPMGDNPNPAFANLEDGILDIGDLGYEQMDTPFDFDSFLDVGDDSNGALGFGSGDFFDTMNTAGDM